MSSRSGLGGGGGDGVRPACGGPPAAMRRVRNTQPRRRTKRSDGGDEVRGGEHEDLGQRRGVAAGAECSASRDPEVMHQATPKTTRPCSWCRTAPSRPVTPKVNQRFAQVLPTAVSSSARKFAAWPPNSGRSDEVEQRVGERRGAADRGEPDRPGCGSSGRAAGASGTRPSSSAIASTGSAAARRGPRTAARCPRRSSFAVCDDVDPAVRVVPPVDGHLVDAQPGPLGEDQQLGVEEPRVVPHERQQPVGGRLRDRLEPALRVGERGRQDGADDAVVGAGDELALRAAHDPAGAAEPGADRDVGVAGQQRRQQRGEPGEVGGEVHVEVGDDPGGRRASRPCGARGRGPSGRGARRRRRAGVSARLRATSKVASVLALSTIVTRQVTGRCSVRWRCSRHTLSCRTCASL